MSLTKLGEISAVVADLLLSTCQ